MSMNLLVGMGSAQEMQALDRNSSLLQLRDVGVVWGIGGYEVGVVWSGCDDLGDGECGWASAGPSRDNCGPISDDPRLDNGSMGSAGSG